MFRFTTSSKASLHKEFIVSLMILSLSTPSFAICFMGMGDCDDDNRRGGRTQDLVNQIPGVNQARGVIDQARNTANQAGQTANRAAQVVSDPGQALDRAAQNAARASTPTNILSATTTTQPTSNGQPRIVSTFDRMRNAGLPVSDDPFRPTPQQNAVASAIRNGMTPEQAVQHVRANPQVAQVTSRPTNTIPAGETMATRRTAMETYGLPSNADPLGQPTPEQRSVDYLMRNRGMTAAQQVAEQGPIEFAGPINQVGNNPRPGTTAPTTGAPSTTNGTLTASSSQQQPDIFGSPTSSTSPTTATPTTTQPSGQTDIFANPNSSPTVAGTPPATTQTGQTQEDLFSNPNPTTTPTNTGAQPDIFANPDPSKTSNPDLFSNSTEPGNDWTSQVNKDSNAIDKAGAEMGLPPGQTEICDSNGQNCSMSQCNADYTSCTPTNEELADAAQGDGSTSNFGGGCAAWGSAETGRLAAQTIRYGCEASKAASANPLGALSNPLELLGQILGGQNLMSLIQGIFPMIMGALSGLMNGQLDFSNLGALASQALGGAGLGPIMALAGGLNSNGLGGIVPGVMGDIATQMGLPNPAALNELAGLATSMTSQAVNRVADRTIGGNPLRGAGVIASLTQHAQSLGEQARNLTVRAEQLMREGNRSTAREVLARASGIQERVETLRGRITQASASSGRTPQAPSENPIRISAPNVPGAPAQNPPNVRVSESRSGDGKVTRTTMTTNPDGTLTTRVETFQNGRPTGVTSSISAIPRAPGENPIRVITPQAPAINPISISVPGAPSSNPRLPTTPVPPIRGLPSPPVQNTTRGTGTATTPRTVASSTSITRRVDPRTGQVSYVQTNPNGTTNTLRPGILPTRER